MIIRCLQYEPVCDITSRPCSLEFFFVLNQVALSQNSVNLMKLMVHELGPVPKSFNTCDKGAEW